jgi:hypothetical protein
MMQTQRVRLPVWSDAWMMGDRIGTLEKTTERKSVSGAVKITVAHVRCDVSGKLRRFDIRDLEAVR